MVFVLERMEAFGLGWAVVFRGSQWVTVIELARSGVR
jgi:hypothetical protein